MIQGHWRRVVLAIGVLTLGVGPWLALPAPAPASQWSAFATAGWGRSLIARAAVAQDEPIRAFAAPTGCTCREVTVVADNIVRNAEVETGDAEVINRSITYIAPTYGDDEVEIEQEAEARTGDAIAGQVLAVNGDGPGCSRVIVHAKNIVEDAEVSSGDATARNESVVLLDPRLNTEDFEVEVDQEAEAESGDAIAGQIIGVKGGGGPCGGVVLDALNRVKDVEVSSGDSSATNLSKVLACRDESCLDEVRLALAFADSVEICDDSGCHQVPKTEFIQTLRQSFDEVRDAEANPTPTPTPDPDERDANEPDLDERDEGDEVDYDENEDSRPPSFAPFAPRRRTRAAASTPVPTSSPTPTTP